MNTFFNRVFIEVIASLVAGMIVSVGGSIIIGQRDLINELSNLIKGEIMRRTDADNRAVLSAIFSGAVLIRNYRADQREIIRLTGGLDLARQSGMTENIKRSEQALEAGKMRRALTYKLYLAQLVQSANDYSTQQYKEQLDTFKQQLPHRQDLKSIERFAELYVMQINSYKDDRVTDEAKLGRQILDFQP